MASWAALNAVAPRTAPERARDVATEEAQEARNAALYERALRRQQQRKNDEAKAIYTQLLESSLGLSPRLRYLCAKNLATLEAELPDHDAAVKYFSEALALDATDVLVWYQMGKAALATGQLWLARQAFESGFQVDAQFWPLVHSLCDVLHAIGDGAAYNRVAQYLVEQDPDAAEGDGPLSAMDEAVDPDFRVLKASRSVKRSQPLKRKSMALEASVTSTKKRKLLTQASRDEAQRTSSRAPLTYLLQQSSWLSLGKLLLEAYQEVLSEQTDSKLRNVRVSVDFSEEPEPAPAPSEAEDNQIVVDEPLPTVAVTEEQVDVNLTEDVHEENTHGTSVEPIEVDQEDEEQHEDEDPRQTSRRKSRRHEEKLREEHELAAKQAREHNLAFRLQAFVPTDAEGDERVDGKTRDVLFRVRQGAVVLETIDGTELHVFEDVFPRPVAEGNAEASAERESEASNTAGSADATRVIDRQEISVFVEQTMATAAGDDVLSLLRGYLNRSGQWAERKLEASSEKGSIHPVVLWAEKAVTGRLEPLDKSTPGQKGVLPSQVALSRQPRYGFTPETRLFLLELDFDQIVQQTPQRGPTRARKLSGSVMAQLDGMQEEAQRLLFDLCWAENLGAGITDVASLRLLARLLWFCGVINEYRGEINDAKDYFTKCKQELGASEVPVVVHLVNLHQPVEISASSVDLKIASLQYSDVRSEAKEMATVAYFDETQTRLLAHFFPADGQTSRIDDLLEDFAASERDAKSREGAEDNGSEEHNLLELILQTVEQSSTAPCSKKILILLVLLDQLLVSLSATGREALSKTGRGEHQRQMKREKISTTIQAIKLTVDRLASIISADANTDATVCSWTRRAAVMGMSKLLDSSIVLLFDSPRDVLVVVCDVEDHLCGEEATAVAADERDKLREHLLYVVFKSFRTIRSLPAPDLQRLLDLSLNTSGSNKSKRRPSARRDRVRPFIQGAIAHMVTGIELLLANILHHSDIKALMEIFCVLLKEEEETLGRRQESDKIGRKIVATGALLFLHLFVASSRGSEKSEHSMKDLVALVELLHERLGQHELCGSKSVDVGGKDGSSFVAVAVDYLSHHRADCANRPKKTNSLNSARGSVQDANGNEKEGEEVVEAEGNDDDAADDAADDTTDSFDNILAQCFRCLYDVHISTDCADHKADVSTQLEDVSVEKAVQLARFAIPMMLRRSPRNNAQKKDNLKILFALRRAIDMDNESRPSPVQPSDALLQFTRPLSVISWDADIPVADSVVSSSQDDECLENVWFLLGENFILQRVRRRSNLTELMEMERRIKERVAFLMKDVHYYRPGRIKSWTRLGKALKELYQVASDACALLLNQVRMGEAILALASMVHAPRSSEIEPNVSAPSFRDYALETSLFETMKEWQEREGTSQKDEFRVMLGDNAEADGTLAESSDQVAAGYRMEEFAATYLSQVVEFAQRCFEMSAALARAQVATNAVDNEASVSKSPYERAEHDQTELKNTAVECCEESGLLLYNYLQEFSSVRRRMNGNTSFAPPKFLIELYGQILDAVHKKFEEGLRSSQEYDLDAHDVRFRLHYMIGKVLKKRVWLEHERSQPQPRLEENVGAKKKKEIETTRAIMACFAAAEEEHEKGKMDKSIVHAFYQLQAMRLELILNESATVEQLTLACDYYFEEAADEEEEEEDEDEKMEDDGDKSTEDEVVKVGKEDVAAILSLADSSGEASISTDYLCLARAWLFYNVIDALESISDEDRYFHPSRHAVARAMYHFHDIVRQLAAIADCPLPDAVAKTSPTACVSILEERKKKKKNDGGSPAESAVKEMRALFDKRRPQVVAIWLSEHVPTSKKFEELNQRQIKFDLCRLKYLRYYVGLLKESHAYARIKEIGSWVLACKEEHDAISEMLAVVFHARGVVQLPRLKDFVCGDLVDQLQRYRAKQDEHELSTAAANGTVDLTNEVEVTQPDDPRDTLVKELGKAYVNYVDVTQSRARLAAVLPDAALQELVLLAEFPVVCLFVIGAIEFPASFDNGEPTDFPTVQPMAEMSPKIRAMLLNEDLSLEVCGASEWKPLLETTRRFCEGRWPDRLAGKAGPASKTSRKPRHTKAPAPSSATPSSPPTAVQEAVPAEPATESGAVALANDGDLETKDKAKGQSLSKATPAEI